MGFGDTWLPTRIVDAQLLEIIAPASTELRVGAKEIRNSFGASIRIYYPAAGVVEGDIKNAKPTPMFRNSWTHYVKGFLWCILGSFLPPLITKAFLFAASLFAWMHPLNWACLPRCFDDLPPKRAPRTEKGKGGGALVVWSHGLTGTGCEHGHLAVALALRGNVVALVQHSDGSSCMTDLETSSRSISAVANGSASNKGAAATMAKTAATTMLPYVHPSFTPTYDLSFRQRQLEHRAAEVEEARRLVLAHPELGPLLDPAKVVVGGFSFGAATAGLCAATNNESSGVDSGGNGKKSKWAAAVLLDGWWHVELKNKGVNLDQPKQVHEGPGLAIPCLFVGSAEFEGYAALNNATKRVQAKCQVPCEVHVLPDTRHGNFMDALWWLPAFVTSGLAFTGKAPPMAVYAHWAALVADFIEKHTADDTE
mmetsp:Transcript_67391/g.115761  ORF Transcript_67391/g.115761 Transcript_67391/m.115761 type:complete len:424 (-) Transcript_67391:105-1376(-)